MLNKRNNEIKAIRAFCLLLAFSVTWVLVSCSNESKTQFTGFKENATYYQYTASSSETLYDGHDIPADMEFVAQSEGCKLFFDPQTTRFAVKNANGFIWYSSLDDTEIENDDIASGDWKRALRSLLTITTVESTGNIVDTHSSYRESVRKKLFTLQYVKDKNNKQIGIRVNFTFETAKMTIPMEIVLVNGKLKVSVLMNDIKNENSNITLLSIGVLPFFGHAGPTDKGYLMVPDGCGGIIHFNNGRISNGPYNEQVYGLDKAYSNDGLATNLETVRLPVFGLKKDEDAFLGIIDSGDAFANIIAETSGIDTKQNFIYPEFKIKQADQFLVKDLSGVDAPFSVYDKKANKYPDIVVLYNFLSDGQADYNGMAKTYQAYLSEKYQLMKHPSENSLMLDFYGAVRKTEPVIGIPMKVKKTLTTFQQASNIIKELNEQGIADIITRYKYATDSKIKKTPQKKLDYPDILGGRKEYGNFQKTNGLNRSYLSVDSIYTSGSLFQLGGAYTKNVMNLPAYQYEYDIITGVRTNNRHFILAPDEVQNKFIQLIDEALKDEYSKSICVEGIGDVLYSNYGERTYTREDTKNVWESILKYAYDKGVKLVVEGANAYAIPYADVIADAPVRSNGYTMIDYDIPFYQMALSGYINCCSQPINLTSNPQYQFLKCIETGSIPDFALVAGEPSVLEYTELQHLYGVDYKKWKSELVQIARKFNQIRELTKNSYISSHRLIMNSVTETTYQNNTKIIINYSSHDVDVDGKTVKSMDYLIR